ncbi:MAG: type II toxin-antitoxin system YafQ family toxin [Gammaproteobacteria bacterium]|nr:type II toxin-antitoxin system YafQ family toxin [Gammaproteobacteria bacterium]
MLDIVTTKQFEKDVKTAKRRGKNTIKLRHVMEVLLNQEKLPLRHRNHLLNGNYADRRECHIEPDWLLIYKLESDCIIFERTGTHSDLFK